MSCAEVIDLTNESAGGSADRGVGRHFGLPNIGNTCYINSTIQCLYNTRCFPRFVREHGGRLLNPFSPLRSKGSKEAYVEMMRWMKTDGVVPRDFRLTEQNDANEFCMHLLDFYLERLRVRAPPYASMKDDLSNTSYEEFIESCRRRWTETFSPIMPVVYAQTARITKCNLCENTCVNVETMPFIHIDSFDVKAGIREVFESKRVPEWRCDACGKTSDTNITTLACVRPPQLLMVCLNRFARTPNMRMSIPRSLSMARFCVEREDHGDEIRYALRSTLNHRGSVHFGHYTANIVLDKETVLKIDDEEVGKPKQVDEQDLKNAYILFYERVVR